ncbi:MAG TPA: CAP domain-containing protein [Solirubrobacterales bacterium]|nr:CAP domain-containing protein [Solirubrobacterales bacterium]
MRSSVGRGAALALIAAIVALGAPSAGVAATRCHGAHTAPRAATGHELRVAVQCLVNAARGRHGLAPLDFSLALQESATAHSRSMERSASFTHYGPHGSTLMVRASWSGYLTQASSFRLAENIATGKGRRFGSPAAIVNDWMHSAGHRENILDPAMRDFGVGVARGDPLGGRHDENAVAYTLDFGARHD